MDTADRTLAAIVRTQHGAFTFAQARVAGFTAAQVKRRVASGAWERARREVLVVASWPASWRRAASVAVLSRPDGALADLTAGRLLGVIDHAPLRPTLTVPPGTSNRSTVANIRRQALNHEEVTRVEGMTCTNAARTLVDLGSILGPVRLARATDVVLQRRLASVANVEAALERVRLSSTAAKAIRDALDVWRPAIRPGSIAEARLLRQLDEWGFDQPERQVEVVDEAGIVVARIDAGWSALRLGLEYDSIEWHGPARWTSDEERHDLVRSLGWTLLHVDADDLRPGSTFRRRLHDVHDRCHQRVVT